MALLDSLLTAMVRANGDALVMHVGEKPIVVAGAKTIDLSSHGLNLGAMVGMLGQLIPEDAQASLQEFGAVEHRLPDRGPDRFTVVAARGGDDIWIEIRRRREVPPVVAAPEAPPAAPIGAAEPDRVAAPELEPAVASVAEITATPEPAVAPEPEVGVEPLEPVRTHEMPELAEAEREPSAEPVMATQAGESQTPEPEIAEPEIGEPEIAEPEIFEPEMVSEPEAPASEAAFEPARESAEEQAPAVASAPELVESPAVEEAAAVAQAPVWDEAAAAAADEASADLEPAPIEVGTRPGDEVPVDLDDATVPEPALDDEWADDGEPVYLGELPDEDAEVEAPEPMAEELAAAHAEESADEQTPLTEPQPVPVMASAGQWSDPVTEVRTPMLPMESPQSPSQVGGTISPAAPPPSAGASTPGGEAPSLTRTVRIEVPSRGGSARLTGADRLLRAADSLGASELFLMSQSRPHVRVAGDLRVLDDEPVMTSAEVDALLAELTPEPWRDAVHRGEPAEWLIELLDMGRVKCASFRDHRGPGAIFRFAATQAMSAEQLGLGREAQMLATEPDGLVVVAGPAGSDKAAIVGAFVDTINRRRSDYVITLEREVRVPHESRQAIISQREVGAAGEGAVAAARAALRENPDVLVVEDVTSGELVDVALDAAAGGRLVLLSIEVDSTAEAVQRLIEMVPADRQAAVRAAMARTFRGSIAQMQLRKASGGRVAAREILMGTHAVSGVIKDGALHEMAATLEAGRGAGMADALVGYVQAGVVDVREAFRKAPNASRLLASLKAAGVDTSAIDRLG